MKRKRLVLTCWIAVALGAAGFSAAEERPLELVRATVDAVIATLKKEDLSAAERRAEIRNHIEKRFSYRAMSQRALGRHWKKTTKEQQKRFVALFAQLLEATYMGRIEAYTDEQVRYDGEEVKGKRAVVDTVIVTRTAEIPIQYRLGLINEKWQVYDVVVEGISLIRNYRTTYDEIFRKEGMEGLLARMEAKAKEMLEESGNK